MRTPKTQLDELIYELLTTPHTTALTMTNKYYIMNVPDVVMRARNKGYSIETKHEVRGNKFGRTITIGKWSLKDKEAALKMYNDS